MKDSIRVQSIHSLFLSILLVVFLSLLTFPRLSSALRPLNDENLTENSPSLVDKQPVQQSDIHLQPINEKSLEDLSPSLVAPSKVEISDQEYNQMMDQKFENSICFKRCHHKNDFHPSENTAKQWRLLIEEDGHAIFAKIPWENPQQKENILNYLFKNARNSKPESYGIGVW